MQDKHDDRVARALRMMMNSDSIGTSLKQLSLPEHTATWGTGTLYIDYCKDAELHKTVLQPIAFFGPRLLVAFYLVLILASATRFADPLLMLFAKSVVVPLLGLLKAASGNSVSPLLTMLDGIAWCFYAVVGLAIAVGTARYNLRPVTLLLTNQSLKFLNTNSQVWKEVLWENVSKVDVVRPSGTKSAKDYLIHFETFDGDRFDIKYGDILDESGRQSFLNALRRRFPAFLDDQLIEVFKPPPSRQSYTELWLKELASPLKRDKLTPLQPGATLQNGIYCVVSKIGAGGQATVYLASSLKHRHGNDDVVALKEFVLPVFPDPRVRKRAAEKFQEEAEMLSRLEHPNIVKFLDLFVEDHRAYLVLERIEGENLKEAVQRLGALQEKFVVSLALQMCGILHYLHSQNPPITHRDFTPDNLILGEDGILRLVDFSVAQEVESNVTGSVVGKPNYISPEQFRGKPTPQSDIYSMGATLYYLLTGQDPEPISVSRPADAVERISPDLDAIVARATQLDLSRRYDNIMSLAQDVQRLPRS